MWYNKYVNKRAELVKRKKGKHMLTYSALTAMPYAQAKVKRETNRIVLISYTTEVAEIVGGCLIVHGLHSATTRRHISAFVREYCGLPYQTARACYDNNMAWDLIEKKFVVIS